MNNYNFWKEVWDSKGNSDSSDLLFLDGYEHIGKKINSHLIVEEIIKILNIKDNDSILEVGCGCGFLSREFQKDYDYTGVDYSLAIINKHKNIFKSHKVYVSEANDLFFKDKTFDHVFCFGLFQYIPNLKYADTVIDEMMRVSSKSVFLGDLKFKKTRETHFVYPKDRLLKKDFIITTNKLTGDDVERYHAYKMR